MHITTLAGRAARCRALALAATVGVLAAAPAASAGELTHVICNYPGATQGAGGAGVEGMSYPRNHVNWSNASERCDGPVDASAGVSVFHSHTGSYPSGTYSALTYAALPDLAIVRGHVYRSLRTKPENSFGKLAVNQHGGPSAADVWGSPRGADQGDWFCCGSAGMNRGSVISPWDPSNRVALAHSASRWSVTIASASGPSSLVDRHFVYRLYGGLVRLRDDANPQLSGEVSGSLVDDGVLAGEEELTANFTDVGAGVYRLRLLVDGVPRLSVPVDPNGGDCVDVAPGNDDPYEFRRQRPCKLSAGGTYGFDTRTLAEGEHNVKVAVLDASGNETVVLNRTKRIDNVPAPSLLEAPTVTGSATAGRTLVASDGVWDDHGADSELVVERRWQRCAADGSACVDVAGRTGAAYDLGPEDVGRRLRVVEIASNGEGRTQAVSLLSDVVAAAPGSTPPGGSGGGGVQQPSGAGARRPSGGGQSLAPGGVNGEGASPRARLTVSWSRGRRVATIAFGKPATATGRLVDEHGRPIRRAIVDVAEVPSVRGAKAQVRPSVVTGADGAFRYTVRRGVSGRVLRFGYRYERSGQIVAADQIRLRVKAAVRLVVRLRGAKVRYSGRVLAGRMPKAGKLVVVQGRVRGGRWQTFAVRRARGKGTFSGRYRLKVRRRGQRLQFRARVPGEAGFPFLAGVSRSVTRVVR